MTAVPDFELRPQSGNAVPRVKVNCRVSLEKKSKMRQYMIAHRIECEQDLIESLIDKLLEGSPVSDPDDEN